MKALEVLDKLVDVVLKYRPTKKKKRKVKRRKSKR